MAAERRSRVKAAAGALALAAGIAAAGCEEMRDPGPARPMVYGGDPAIGNTLIREYGCGTCHTVPGVRGARGLVGPPLTKFAHRSYVAGNLPNTPQNVVSWIVNPQAVEPGTAMPDMGVTQEEARHIAAYLYTLR